RFTPRSSDARHARSRPVPPRWLGLRREGRRLEDPGLQGRRTRPTPEPPRRGPHEALPAARRRGRPAPPCPPRARRRGRGLRGAPRQPILPATRRRAFDHPPPAAPHGLRLSLDREKGFTP